VKRTMGEILIAEAPVWGVSLSRREDKLVVRPASKCPPALKDLLLEHKAEIMDLLEAQGDGLKPDQAPWRHVAKQILAGEFDGADPSTRESLAIGLRSIHDPTCRAALEVLAAGQKKERQ
jgi:hypothetical protein